jgi:hypothetical protein
MRDKLNNNPIAQVVAIGALLVFAAFFAMSAMGGGESESGTSATSAEVETAEGPVSVTAPEGIPVEAASASGLPEVPAPALPRPVTRALDAGQTVALLIVKRGALDDAVAAASATAGLTATSDIAVFPVPVDRIARYARITQVVKVNRAPALVIVDADPGQPGVLSASVNYGYQTPQSAIQAVIDARYRGQTLDYHP